VIRSSHEQSVGRSGSRVGVQPAIGALPAGWVVLLMCGPVAAQPLADEHSHWSALRFYRAAQRAMAAEKFEVAVEQFLRAVQNDRLLTIAHYGLRHAYMDPQQYPRAIKAFESCIEASRELHAIAQTRQAEADRLRQDEIRELGESIRLLHQHGPESQAIRAEQHLEDLRTHRPSPAGVFRAPAEVLLSLGSAQFRSGNLAIAETEWKTALQVNPKFGEAHNNLAVAYMISNRLEEAEAEIEQAERSGFRVNPQFKRDLVDRMRSTR
jgi:tetratricopeptide (TPR) repeat protein